MSTIKIYLVMTAVTQKKGLYMINRGSCPHGFLLIIVDMPESRNVDIYDIDHCRRFLTCNLPAKRRQQLTNSMEGFCLFVCLFR